MIKSLKTYLSLSTAVFVVSGLLLLAPAPVQAVDVLSPVCQLPAKDGKSPEVCRDNNTDGENPITGANGLLSKYVRILSFVVGLFSTAMVIFGGIRFITSNGDPKSVETGRKTVLYALAGLLLAVIAQGLVIFVLSKTAG